MAIRKQRKIRITALSLAIQWTLLLLFFSLQFPSSASLFLQIGEKCVHEVQVPFLEDSNNLTFPTFEHKENASFLQIEAEIPQSPTASICDPDIPLECLSGRCQCKKGYTINRNGTKCLEVARNGLESPCEENIQCWKSLLGRMSECNVAIGKCQCYESETLPIVFHQGRCYYGESLGEYCQIEGLCEATTPNATCRSNNVGGSGGTCQCKDGYVASWDKSRCLPVATQGLDSPCEENIQCEKSQLGALSECNQETMRCNCYKIPDMDTVFHGGKCYIEAALGDVCQVAAQCQKKTKNSVCSRQGKCFCDDGYAPNANNTLCTLVIPSSDGVQQPENNDGQTHLPTTVNNNISTYSNGINGECQEDSQCVHILGPYSRCNSPKQKCECHVRPYHAQHNYHHRSGPYLSTSEIELSEQMDLYENDQISSSSSSSSTLVVIMIGSKCHLGRFLGHSCRFNKQCSAMTENSWCDKDTQRCECLDGTHVSSEDGRKCLKIAQKGLHAACDENAQCSRSELGPLAYCSPERKSCECSNNIMPVVYYKGKCYFHRQLGSSCETNVECQAGSNYLAECNLGRCRCQNGTTRISPHVCTFTKMGNAASSHIGMRVSIFLVLLFSIFYIVT